MIDALVRLSEKIILLIELRQKRQKIRYETFIAPIYVALQDLHSSNLQLLDRCQQSLEQKLPLGEIERSVIQEGLKTEVFRRDVASKLAAFASVAEDDTHVQFFKAAQHYLSNPSRSRSMAAKTVASTSNISVATIRSMLVSILAKEASEGERAGLLGLTRHEHRIACDLVIAMWADLRQTWDRVAETHARAQVQSVK